MGIGALEKAGLDMSLCPGIRGKSERRLQVSSLGEREKGWTVGKGQEVGKVDGLGLRRKWGKGEMQRLGLDR